MSGGKEGQSKSNKDQYDKKNYLMTELKKIVNKDQYDKEEYVMMELKNWYLQVIHYTYSYT